MLWLKLGKSVRSPRRDHLQLPVQAPPLGVFKNDEVSKIYELCMVSHGFDLAESKYAG